MALLEGRCVPRIVDRGGVLFYGVVSPQTEKVGEFFLERDAAEAMMPSDVDVR